MNKLPALEPFCRTLTAGKRLYTNICAVSAQLPEFHKLQDAAGRIRQHTTFVKNPTGNTCRILSSLQMTATDPVAPFEIFGGTKA